MKPDDDRKKALEGSQKETEKIEKHNQQIRDEKEARQKKGWEIKKQLLAGYVALSNYLISKINPKKVEKPWQPASSRNKNNPRPPKDSDTALIVIVLVIAVMVMPRKKTVAPVEYTYVPPAYIPQSSPPSIPQDTIIVSAVDTAITLEEIFAHPENQMCCTWQGLKIRDSSSISGNILGILEKNELVYVLDVKPATEENIPCHSGNNYWYYIKTIVPPVKIGWVHGGNLEYLIESAHRIGDISSKTALFVDTIALKKLDIKLGNVLYTLVPDLKIRDGYSRQDSILRRLQKNELVFMDNISEDDKWFHIKTIVPPIIEGCVRRSYVKHLTEPMNGLAQTDNPPENRNPH